VKYGALEYAYAAPIAAALSMDSKFGEWVFSRTKFDATSKGARVLAEEMKSRRSKAATDWWRSHFTEKCRCDGCRGQETDLLAIFELESGRRVAIHFEVKQPTDVFHAGQGRAYALRAACWIRNAPKAVVPHDDAATILLCSADRVATYGTEPREFDAVITFEDIVAAFPGVIPRELVTARPADS
jgi:hypothetical protein